MNFVLVILAILGGLWILTGVGKSFRRPPPAVSSESQDLKKQSHESAADINLKQEKLMRDLKQKIQDNRR